MTILEILLHAAVTHSTNSRPYSAKVHRIAPMYVHPRRNSHRRQQLRTYRRITRSKDRQDRQSARVRWRWFFFGRYILSSEWSSKWIWKWMSRAVQQSNKTWDTEQRLKSIGTRSFAVICFLPFFILNECRNRRVDYFIPDKRRNDFFQPEDVLQTRRKTIRSGSIWTYLLTHSD